MNEPRKHDPYDHNPKDVAWKISPYSGDNSGSCVAFNEWPNGDLWISDDKISLAERTWQAYRREERVAVLKVIVAGHDDAPFTLTEEERQEILALVEARNPGLVLTQ